MYNIVDNLQSQDSLTFLDVRSRLLERSGSSNLSSNGKAPNTGSNEVNKFYKKKKNTENPNPTRPGETKPVKCNQCS